jgi:hypothetical protein
LFVNLCEKYLDINVLPYIDVKNCRRLKSNRPVQPLLISFTREGPVEELLLGAKRLRDAMDAYVRDSIFLNADLTPTDSKLAFEIRQKRRESNKQKMESKSSAPSTYGASKFSDDAHRGTSGMEISEPASQQASTSTFVYTGNRFSILADGLGDATHGAVSSD